MSAMRSGPGWAQGFCVVAGLVLVAAGVVRLSVFHIATGVVLLAAAPGARSARVVCVVLACAYALVSVLGWLHGSDAADNALNTALALLALAAAAAPAPAGRPTAAPGLPPAG